MNWGGGLATLTVYPCDGAAMALAAAPRGSAQGLFSAPKYYPEDTCNYQTRTQSVFDTWNRAGHGLPLY